MDKRDKALIHYAVIMTLHNDARRVANTLRNKFTAEERQEIKELTEEYVRLGRSEASREKHVLK